MGKNAGVTDWHRHQRKKEVLKNKEARIAARDKRVVAEKTVAEVKDEICKIEKHYKNPEQRPHNIKSKLDRLTKELQLVRKKEEEDKNMRQQTVQDQRDALELQTKRTFQPLDNPIISIYYDPVMNPYGAPPPGQQSLYYRRGGGTTTNLNEACTPADQFLPPPPPIRQQQQQSPSEHADKQKNRLPHPPLSRKVLPRSTQKPSSNATNITIEPHANNVSNLKVVEGLKHKLKSIDPSQLPILPKPSSAVERSKAKLAADIWASMEEIEYEEAVTSVSLEGVAAGFVVANTRHKHQHQHYDVWFYKDSSSMIQGPFPTEQMVQWVQGGYFPSHTPVCGTNQDSPWTALRDVVQLNRAVQKQEEKKIKADKRSSVEDRIAALRKGNGEQAETDSSNGNDDAPTMPSSVEDRIAALGQTRLQESQRVTGSGGKNDATVEDPDIDDSIQGRAVALQEEQARVVDGDDSFQDRIQRQILKSVRPDDDSIQNRIAALRGELTKREDTEHNDEMNSVLSHIASIGALHGQEQGLHLVGAVPPPPPPLFCGDSDHAMPSYQVDDDEVAPYPAEYENGVPYSATTGPSFPSADTYELHYPVDDYEYPVTGDYRAGYDACPSVAGDCLLPPKKKVKVDKAIVSFLPSHIQKRNIAFKGTASVKQKKPNTVLDDEFQRLLKETGED